MKYLSLFSGIGTGEKAIEQAYHHQYESTQSRASDSESGRERITDQSRDGVLPSDHSPLCVGFSEIDRHAAAIYRFHFDHHNLGDATKIDERELPDFDFLIAGFPCQAFSIAGKRQGFDDTRGTLFFDIARILAHKRPAHFLLENVKGLSSHNNRETVVTIHQILSGLGYFVERVLLNSKDYGVPQNRERLFFIGHLADRCSREIFSFGENYSGTAQRPKQATVNTLTAGGHSGGMHSSMTLLQTEETKGMADAHRVYEGEGLARTLKGEGGGLGAKTGLYAVALTETRTDEAREIRRQNLAEGRDWSPRRGKTLVPRNDDQANTLTSTQTKEQMLLTDRRIRRLTPNECERLQGLPDDFTQFGNYDGEIKEVSDTQRYRGLGNSFTVNTVEAIISRMLEVGCL